MGRSITRPTPENRSYFQGRIVALSAPKHLFLGVAHDHAPPSKCQKWLPFRTASNLSWEASSKIISVSVAVELHVLYTHTRSVPRFPCGSILLEIRAHICFFSAYI